MGDKDGRRRSRRSSRSRVRSRRRSSQRKSSTPGRRQSRKSTGRRKSGERRPSKVRRRSSGRRASQDRRRSSGRRDSKARSRDLQKSSIVPPGKKQDAIEKVRIWNESNPDPVSFKSKGSRGWEGRVLPHPQPYVATDAKATETYPPAGEEGKLELVKRPSRDDRLQQLLEDEDEESGDPLNLPPTFMYTFEPTPASLNRKCNVCCSCEYAAILSFWCKFLAYVEMIFGIVLSAFKVTVMVYKPGRQPMVAKRESQIVDYSELTLFVVIFIAGAVLLIAAAARAKIACLLHTLLVILEMLLLIGVIVLLFVFVDFSKTTQYDEKVLYILQANRISCIILLLWSAIMSALLYYRIDHINRMEYYRPSLVPTPQPSPINRINNVGVMVQV